MTEKITDCANPIPGSRLSDILSSDRVVPNEEKTSTTFGVEESETRACTSSDQNQSTDTLLSHLSHFMAQSLPHLIALLCHTPTSFPAENTALIVIDSLSSLIAAAYPRTQENPTTPQKPGIGTLFLYNTSRVSNMIQYRRMIPPVWLQRVNGQYYSIS